MAETVLLFAHGFTFKWQKCRWDYFKNKIDCFLTVRQGKAQNKIIRQTRKGDMSTAVAVQVPSAFVVMYTR